MPPFDVGVVITAPAGRGQNLSRVLQALQAQTLQPKAIVLVFDGCEPYALPEAHTGIHAVRIDKHGPGREQPRNVGVRELQRVAPECEWVWFLDSDVQPAPDCLAAFASALDANPARRVLIGPYDWLPDGVMSIQPDGPFFQWDDRRGSNGFADFEPDHVIKGDITALDPEDGQTRGTVSFLMGAGGAQYGGNLVWPLDAFTRIGGFHPELHHGRCEDGELGFRAIAHGIGVSFVRDARGYHLSHDRDMPKILAMNAIDVPKLHQFHPWLIDYKRVPFGGVVKYDFHCGVCGSTVDSTAWWEHACNAR